MRPRVPTCGRPEADTKTRTFQLVRPFARQSGVAGASYLLCFVRSRIF
jgi:hypothetical protein